MLNDIGIAAIAVVFIIALFLAAKTILDLYVKLKDKLSKRRKLDK